MEANILVNQDGICGDSDKQRGRLKSGCTQIVLSSRLSSYSASISQIFVFGAYLLNFNVQMAKGYKVQSLFHFMCDNV